MNEAICKGILWSFHRFSIALRLSTVEFFVEFLPCINTEITRKTNKQKTLTDLYARYFSVLTSLEQFHMQKKIY